MDKGISNIIVITFLILITISAIGLLAYYISPILTFDDFGEIDGTLSPAENKTYENGTSAEGNLNQSIGNCSLKRAYWSNNSGILDQGVDGEEIGMIVEGERCEGLSVQFVVYEDDFLNGRDSVNELPQPVFSGFNNGKAQSSWNAEWQEDCSGLCNPPEFYFEALIGGRKIKSNLISIGKTLKDLSPIEECKSIIVNGDDKIDIVIFADNETASEYADHMTSFSPLRQNKDLFNFYYIDDYKPECEIFKGIALLCRSKEMIKRASSCPNDYILAAEEHDTSVRSSAFMNIMSINSRLPLSVVQHEFGHVFASLAEEYIPAILPKEAKNCVSGCGQFGNVNDGCFAECSRADYYRSIENGVMRTLSSSEYGKFNEKLILERMGGYSTAPITGGVIDEVSQCDSQRYYLLEGVYDYELDDVQFIKATIEYGCADFNSNGYGGAEIIVSDGDAAVASVEFNPVYIFTDGLGDSGINEDIEGETFSNVDPFYVKIPVIGDDEKVLTTYIQTKHANYRLESTGDEVNMY